MTKTKRLAAASIFGAILLVLALASVGVARFAGLAGTPARLDDATTDQQLATLAIGGKFTLLDQTGHTVTEASFHGSWLLIYFGYTTCPDVCPTTLQTMVAALDQLGARAARITPLFITVDPARDTPAVLAGYTGLFDKRLIGLTGTSMQLAQAEKTFRVYAARADQPGTHTYLMDHTSFIYLMDPAGHLRALFDRTTTASVMATRLGALLT